MYIVGGYDQNTGSHLTACIFFIDIKKISLDDEAANARNEMVRLNNELAALKQKKKEGEEDDSTNDRK